MGKENLPTKVEEKTDLNLKKTNDKFFLTNIFTKKREEKKLKKEERKDY